MAPDWSKTLDAVRSLKAVVGVVGLGYVGLPLALAFAEKGFRVIGFDVDDRKVESINRGKSYLLHFESHRIAELREEGKLEATADFDRLGEPDALIICVPTPLSPDGTPELVYVETTTRAIAKTLRPGQLVVLESTTYPGTTDEVLKPLLDASGLACGKDYLLAYSPEREDPGNPKFGMTEIPKVIGASDELSLKVATALYGQVVRETVPVSNTRVAEASKLTENIFRAVNIALVNELKILFDRMDIDVWEVLEAASTKPFGFMRFDPGPGWGGHCIPIDPFYLAWRAEQLGLDARFIRLAGEVNLLMPTFVVKKLEAALHKSGVQLGGSKILIVGLAYKKDVADPRESPAFQIIKLLQERAAEVHYHDPYIPEAPMMRSWQGLGPMKSVELTPTSLASYDAAILVTNHECIDYEKLLEHSSLIVDTRGRYRAGSEKVVPA